MNGKKSRINFVIIALIVLFIFYLPVNQVLAERHFADYVKIYLSDKLKLHNCSVLVTPHQLKSDYPIGLILLQVD